MIDLLDTKWQPGSIPQSIKDGEAHLWRIDLEGNPASVSAYFELLSDDEKMRAGKYVFSSDANHFIECRAKLRMVLGGYLGIPAEKIQFSMGRFGKPFLSGGHDRLGFNVSHSRGIAVIAVSVARRVGVDLEYVDENFDVMEVAPSVFPHSELSKLRALSRSARAKKFFTRWTRKEAFLKATGDGLSSSEELQSAVSLISDEDTVYRLVESGSNTCWSLTSFETDKFFKASLVVEGDLRSLKFWHLSEDYASSQHVAHVLHPGLVKTSKIESTHSLSAHSR